MLVNDVFNLSNFTMYMTVVNLASPNFLGSRDYTVVVLILDMAPA